MRSNLWKTINHLERLSKSASRLSWSFQKWSHSFKNPFKNTWSDNLRKLTRNYLYLILLFIKLLTTNKSSRRNCSIKKAVLKTFAILPGKHMCWSFFLIKLQTSRMATLLKKKTTTQVFSCEYCEFLRITILKNICERLLLDQCCHRIKTSRANQLSGFYLMRILVVNSLG